MRTSPCGTGPCNATLPLALVCSNRGKTTVFQLIERCSRAAFWHFRGAPACVHYPAGKPELEFDRESEFATIRWLTC